MGRSGYAWGLGLVLVLASCALLAQHLLLARRLPEHHGAGGSSPLLNGVAASIANAVVKRQKEKRAKDLSKRAAKGQHHKPGSGGHHKPGHEGEKTESGAAVSTNGQELDWRPRWAGQAPKDAHGLGSRVYQLLQDRPEGDASPASAYEVARQLLEAAQKAFTPLRMLEVGACDGKWQESNDPIQELMKHPQVRAVALEPVPALFQELEMRLAALPKSSNRLLAVNAALCLEEQEHVPFYVVSPRFVKEFPNAEHWVARELGSFQKSHLKKHRVPERYIEKTEVMCLTPLRLFNLTESPIGADPGAVNLALVDAEGMDAELVDALFAVPGFSPAVIIFEQKHIRRKRLRALLEMLRGRHYVHWQDGAQVVALLAAPTLNETALSAPGRGGGAHEAELIT